MSPASCTLVGNLIRDPELRYTPSGVAVCQLVVAVNFRTKKDGEWVDGDPEFWDVVVWRQYGENVAEAVRKGDRVIVSGDLRKQKWETKEGETRWAVEVRAEEVGSVLRFAKGRGGRPAAESFVPAEKGGQSDVPF